MSPNVPISYVRSDTSHVPDLTSQYCDVILAVFFLNIKVRQQSTLMCYMHKTCCFYKSEKLGYLIPLKETFHISGRDSSN